MSETLTIDLGGRIIALSKKKLDIKDDPLNVDRDRILAYRTRRAKRLPPKYGLDVRVSTTSGSERWMQLTHSSSEGACLEAVEQLAEACSVRFEEHTGRSVEADEHGLDVVTQMRRFPSRWERCRAPERLRAFVSRTKDGLDVQLPSKVDTFAFGLLLGLLLLSTGVGLMVGFAQGSLQTALTGIAAAIPFWIILVVLGNSAGGLFEHRHRIVITSERVEVHPKVLRFLPGRSRRHPISEFRDLDVTNSGRLALLLDDRRISCDMFRREAQWVIGRIASVLEDSSSAIDSEE